MQIFLFFLIQMMIVDVIGVCLFCLYASWKEGDSISGIVVVGVSLKLYYYPLTSLHKHSLTVIYIYPKRKHTDAQDMTTDQLHERDVFPRPSHHDIQSVKFLSYHVHHSLSADIALDPHGRNCFLTHSYQLPGLSLGR